MSTLMTQATIILTVINSEGQLTSSSFVQTQSALLLDESWQSNSTPDKLECMPVSQMVLLLHTPLEVRKCEIP